MNKKYTKEMLEPIVKESFSVADVCRKLQIKPATGSQSNLSKRIQEYDLDTSHFTGQGWNKGKTFVKYPIEDYLSNERFVKSSQLLKRLIKEGYKTHKCERCQLTKWLEEKIPLELHHVNKNHEDNNLENLQILCSNCHSLAHK